MKRSALLVPAVFCTFAAVPAHAYFQAAPSKPAPTAPAATTPPPSLAPASSGASSLTPRGPEAVAAQDPSRVVATIGGKDVTAKQALEILQAVPPDERKRNESRLADVVRQVYMEDATAEEAARMKLDQQSPWKEQLRLTRDNILTQAYITRMASSGTAAPDPKAYYDAHPQEFDQIKLSGILVAFNPPGTPSNGSGIQRTDAAALEKANDLAKKIKAGGDFSALARTDSDNQQSSVRGGDLGSFTMDNPQIPQTIKDAVAKLQPQQVSEPVRIPGGYYLLRLDSRTHLTFEQARDGINQKQQQEKSQALLKQQLDKYNIQVKDAEFFAGSGPRIPSLQRPAGAPPAPAKPQ